MNTIEILESLQALIDHGFLHSMVQGLEALLDDVLQ